MHRGCSRFSVCRCIHDLDSRWRARETWSIAGSSFLPRSRRGRRRHVIGLLVCLRLFRSSEYECRQRHNTARIARRFLILSMPFYYSFRLLDPPSPSPIGMGEGTRNSKLRCGCVAIAAALLIRSTLMNAELVSRFAHHESEDNAKAD